MAEFKFRIFYANVNFGDITFVEPLEPYKRICENNRIYDKMNSPYAPTVSTLLFIDNKKNT